MSTPIVVLRKLALCRTNYPLRSGRPTVRQGVSTWIVTYCSYGKGGSRKETPSALSKTFPGKSIHTEISPLRCAPVEMTKGRAALPLSVVAEQSLFFINLGGPKAHNFSGRDDKGAGVGGRKQWALRQQAH